MFFNCIVFIKTINIRIFKIRLHCLHLFSISEVLMRTHEHTAHGFTTKVQFYPEGYYQSKKEYCSAYVRLVSIKPCNINKQCKVQWIFKCNQNEQKSKIRTLQNMFQETEWIGKHNMFKIDDIKKYGVRFGLQIYCKPKKRISKCIYEANNQEKEKLDGNIKSLKQTTLTQMFRKSSQLNLIITSVAKNSKKKPENEEKEKKKLDGNIKSLKQTTLTQSFIVQKSSKVIVCVINNKKN